MASVQLTLAQRDLPIVALTSAAQQGIVSVSQKLIIEAVAAPSSEGIVYNGANLTSVWYLTDPLSLRGSISLDSIITLTTRPVRLTT